MKEQASQLILTELQFPNHWNLLYFFYLTNNLQAKITHEIMNSKAFNIEHQGIFGNGKKSAATRLKSSASSKARSMMNLHNNEAGRRVRFAYPIPNSSIQNRSEMLNKKPRKFSQKKKHRNVYICPTQHKYIPVYIWINGLSNPS